MRTASDRPLWERDGADWPNRSASRFVVASDLTWHVQELGAPEAPVLLLLHGTGAATHSWAGLAPLLAPHFRVVALDLPGHGFTDPLPSRMTLAYRLDINEWRGERKVQFLIEAAQGFEGGAGNMGL